MSGDSLFDRGGGVLHDGYFSQGRRYYCGSLCSPELEHTLHILAIKRGLYSQLSGVIALNECRNALMYLVQPIVVTPIAVELEHTHGEEFALPATGAQYTVSEDDSARIYADDDAFRRWGR